MFLYRVGRKFAALSNVVIEARGSSATVNLGFDMALKNDWQQFGGHRRSIKFDATSRELFTRRKDLAVSVKVELRSARGGKSRFGCIFPRSTGESWPRFVKISP